MSTELMAQKIGIEIGPAAFTDNHAVVLLIAIPNHEVRRRRGRWKLDQILMKHESLKGKIRNERAKWRIHKRYYSHVVMWWERGVKKQLQFLIRQEDIERHKKNRVMENHLGLYEFLYDILRSDAPETEKSQLCSGTTQNQCASTPRGGRKSY
jgi:hypothetical protein